MALLEDRTAVFIVRVWCERGDDDCATNEWRGSVEHVASGQRVFFRHLEAVQEFMKPHLRSIGIDAQQRFWERISAVIDDAPAQATADAPVTVRVESPTTISAARKRR
ncbi:hypothetical protein [Lysobacter fragariae]